MWEFLMQQLLREAGRKIAGRFFNDEANGPEVYADRIKRDFGLHDYADARRLYGSDRAYWERYYAPLPEPDWKSTAIRDSAAAAGIPSRTNVFEYGYPALIRSGEVSSDQRSSNQAAPRDATPLNGGLATRIAALTEGNASVPAPPNPFPQMGAGKSTGNQPSPSVFDAGAPPIPYLSPARQSRIGGLPAWIASLGGGVASNLSEPVPPAGGLAGLLLEWRRNNQDSSVSR